MNFGCTVLSPAKEYTTILEAFTQYFINMMAEQIEIIKQRP